MQFLKKTMGVTEDDPQKELKDELKHLFAKLCGKLDALCNFHYTPKAAIPEMKVGGCVTACYIYANYDDKSLDDQYLLLLYLVGVKR